ncbi:MAG: nitric oxide reductase transcription regulator [Bdellovibrionales bacterium GWA2_49_15]|nr:MAG: nitric oxide reductase transcription regulator [Bdellovibrionales bacterium GWA2_49_15]HAZ13037.1 nitric oxide reductase transcriptional regulator NorR [Bdellovibrionales bacterium]
MQTAEIKTLVEIALDLNLSLSSKDRYHRLLRTIRKIIPCDASSLLVKKGDSFVPLASHGLRSDALSGAYNLRDHPRLNIIASAQRPVRFPSDSELPDPFDGLIEAAAPSSTKVHACLGCPLIVEGELIGALTADALRPGAFDHLSDEFLIGVTALAGATLRTSAIIDRLETVAQHQRSLTKDLMKQLGLRGGNEIMGVEPIIIKLKEDIKLVAKSDLSVLIQGETGTGKELVAKSIHGQSSRADIPLIYLNCAALPESIAESELFGHKKGSFTGAVNERAGKFEIANGGTIFLDEIGELSLGIQAKILRTIQEGEIQRVGEDRTRKVNVRVIAATNRDLEVEIKQGRFRADLFHRLNVFPIKTPALREHANDIPLLATYLCDTYQRRFGTLPVRLSPATLSLLQEYSWPGNVRELKNVISRAVLLSSRQIHNDKILVIKPEHLPGLTQGPPNETPPQIATSGKSMAASIEEFKTNLILETVKKYHGNWAQAAKELGLHRSNLYHLRDRLGLSYSPSKSR